MDNDNQQNKPMLSGAQEHVFTTDAKRWETLKQYARIDRKAPTAAENLLWQELRGGRLDAKFRRQHAIESFIVDFACLAAKLIVEVDGEIHQEVSQAEYDAGRTCELQALGYRILRFTNAQVIQAMPKVLQHVRTQLELKS